MRSKDTYPRDSSFGDKDVVCCFAKTILGAEELCGEYQQQWLDSGGKDDAYYYVVGNIFYDR